MQHHVFLSYSHRDTLIMARVRDYLRTEGLKVWTDEGITPGTPQWDQAIELALRNTGSMVVILTPNVINSDGVRNEIHYATIHKVQIFPLLAGGDESSSIPYTLAGRQFADVRSQYDVGMASLTQSVCKHVGVESASQRQAREAKETARKAEEEHQRQLQALQIQRRYQEEALQRQREAQIREQQRLDAQRKAALAEEQRRIQQHEQRAKRREEQLSLLWWVFVVPEKFAKYKINHSAKTITKIGFEVVSTTIWLPFFIPIVGIVLGRVRQLESPPLGISFLIWGIIIIALWYSTNLMSRIGYADLLMVVLVGCAAGFVAAVLSHGFIVGVQGGALRGPIYILLVAVIGITAVVAAEQLTLNRLPLGIVIGIISGVAGGTISSIIAVPISISAGTVSGLAAAILIGGAAYWLIRLIRATYNNKLPPWLRISLFSSLVIAYSLLILMYWVAA